MTALTTNWLQPRPIPREFDGRNPESEYERGLNDWLRLRGDELDLPLEKRPDCAYYARVHSEFQRGHALDFDRSEAMREGIRKGILDPTDDYVDALNTPAPLILAWEAYQLGWRLTPRGRHAAVLFQHPFIAHQIETECRRWVGWAEGVWQGIVRMPDNRRNRESHRATVEPLLIRARELNLLVTQRLRDSGMDC